MTPRAFVAKLYPLRWVVVLLLVLLVALSGWGAAGVRVVNAIDVWFVEGDPALEAYDAFQDRFGNDEIVILAVTHPDGVLSPAGVERLRAVSDAAAGTPGIADVVSLATLSHARVPSDWVGEDWEAPPLEIGPVLEAGSGETLEAIVLEDPLLAGRLVSRDGKVALVLAQMDRHDDMDAVRDGILADLTARVEAAAGEHVPQAGTGVIFSALNQASTRDTLVLGSVSYLLVMVLLWVLLGRPGPVILSMTAVGAAAIVPLGVAGALGYDLNMVTMTMPTLVFIIGVADAVHMLHAVAEQRGDDAELRVIDGLGAVLWPCLFTSLTTAAGFLALVSARMPVVRQLGVFSTVGVLAALIITVALILAAGRFRFFQARARDDSLLVRFLGWLAGIAVEYRITVLGTGVFALLLGAWGTSRIDPDTYSIEYFYADHPVRIDSDTIEDTFGPYTPLEFVVHVPEGGRHAEVLAAVARWQDAMEADANVGWTRSPADVPRRLHQLLTDGDPSSYRVPPDDGALEEALWIWESDPDVDLSSVVDDEWTVLRVTVGLDMMSARGIAAAIERLEALAELPEGATVESNGYLPLYVTMMDYVVRSQILSFAVAFVLIFGLLAVGYRSVRMAVLAIPANLFPVFVTLGVMGALGIRLDVATVTIAAIVLGLVVDDTVHFLYRFRLVLRETGSHEEAVRRVMTTTGVAMTTTTVVLTAGFSVLVLATVKSVAFFGLLVATAAGTALVGDLLLLPALLVTLRPRL